MDYIPPPPVESAYIRPISHTQDERFIIEIDEARYDEERRLASITMDKAFQKSHRIESYKGDVITLVYKGAMPQINHCPSVRVPLDDVRRDIDLVDNEVTLTIANIPQSLADDIAQNLCLLIDTYTVKKVANPDFEGQGEGPAFNE